MPIAEAVQMLRLHFSEGEKDPYFALIPFHKMCFKLLSPGVPSGDGAIAVGAAVFVLNPQDNTVDLSKNDGVIGTLAHRLLCGPPKEIPGDTAIVPPQLSIPKWMDVRTICAGYTDVQKYMDAYCPCLGVGLSPKDDRVQWVGLL